MPGLDLLPCNIDLAAAEVQLVNEVAREQSLYRALAPRCGRLRLHAHRLPALARPADAERADRRASVIVPLECEYFALRGVALLTDTIAKVQDRLNPTCAWRASSPRCSTRARCTGARSCSRVVEAFGDGVFHTVIGRTVKFPETTVVGEPITT